VRRLSYIGGKNQKIPLKRRRRRWRRRRGRRRRSRMNRNARG